MSLRIRRFPAVPVRLTTVVAVVSAVALATAGGAGAASAAQPAHSTIPLGDGYAGAGYAQDAAAAGLTPVVRQAQAGLTVTPDAVGPAGIDVSHYQGTIAWSSVKAAGISFAYIKATEGTTYTDPMFSANYLHAYQAKVIRGAYHFAQPSASSGATQAAFFATHGGAWSRDNLTLPGMLDLEGGCYGMSTTSMRNWILDFYNTYKARTTRDVVIYTSPNWWNTCTGGWSGMSARSPLYVADWTTASSPVIPGGFPYATLWQYTDNGRVSGVAGAVDRDWFCGSAARLLALANNS